MLFGDFDNTFLWSVLGLIRSGINISHILAFNEPDGPFDQGGSQVTPEAAAARWIADIEPLKQHGVSLGAPAVTGSVRGVQWLQDFFAACNGRCSADFLPLHFYGPLAGLQWIVNTTRALYPNMSTWITEFADPDQPLRITQQQYNASVAWLDQLPFVARYAYFGSFRSHVSNVGYNATLLDACGNLTDLGDWYLDRPAQGNVPTLTSCPALPPEVHCPASDGTNFTDPATGAVFSIECFVDHPHGDMPNTGFTTGFVEECIAACANRTGCVDVSWVGGPCYEKQGVLAAAVSDSAVWGARLVESGV
jgi:hypothetical protein